MHGNTLVHVYEADYFHTKIRMSTVRQEGLTIAECALCDKPAVYLDHLFPNHAEMNRCEEHRR
jgi:hypothetical protein